MDWCKYVQNHRDATFDLPDTEARYVRIVGLGNSDGSAFTSLSEVNLYAPFANGDTPVANIPNYTPNPPGTDSIHSSRINRT